MFLDIVLLIVGLALLLYCGNLFVDSSIAFGKRLRIPTIIVGATIVSVATTMPELLVSTIAAFDGSFGLSIGNSVGSVICNTCLICGLSMTILPSVLGEDKNLFKYALLLFSSVLLFIFGFTFTKSLSISWYEALVLLTVFVLFFMVNVLEAVKKSKTENVLQKKLKDNSKAVNGTTDAKASSELEEIPKKFDKLWKIFAFFIIGAAGIAVGAILMVDSSKSIALSLGISEAFIGFTIAAVGTSLPELVTTIVSVRRKNSALGYGNIIGANIINLTLIVGLSGVIAGNAGLSLSTLTFAVSLPLAIICSVVFVVPLMIKNRSYKWQGITLLSLYAAYIIFLAIATFKGLVV